jgi:hypothetical protein
MKAMSSLALRERRRELLMGLPPLTRLLRGSLVETYKRCGRPGCRCASGDGHGPKHYLSVSTTGQRSQLSYLPKAAVGEAAEYLANFRAVRATLNEICAINTELLRRHEDLE